MAPPVINLSLWEQKVYEFGIDLNAILHLPAFLKPSADFGSIGLNLSLTCPGAPFCQNPNPCSTGNLLPLKLPGFSIKLPSLTLPSLPPFKIRVVVPPAIIIPLSCPFYPNETKPVGA